MAFRVFVLIALLVCASAQCVVACSAAAAVPPCHRHHSGGNCHELAFVAAGHPAFTVDLASAEAAVVSPKLEFFPLDAVEIALDPSPPFGSHVRVLRI